MKKTLALLTLSLLLVAAMMLGVSAAVADSDVGVYIRFSTGEAVESHVNETYTTAVFDAERGALAIYPKVPAPGESGNDNNVYIYLSELVDVKQYPFFRATYELVNTTNPNAGNREAFTYLNISTTGKWINKNVAPNMLTNDGKIQRAVADYSTGIGSDGLGGITSLETLETFMVGDLRMDWPNDVAADHGQYIVYLYDIGFFKTEEAAYAYNPDQSFYLLDLSDEATIAGATVQGGTLTYDEEEDAAIFTHAAAPEEEGRVTITIPENKRFSVGNYPYVSMMSASTEAALPHAFYFIDNAIKGGYAMKANYRPTDVANTFGISSAVKDAGIADNLVMESHMFDPVNIFDLSTATGKEQVYIKYVAYYATQEEANLETQFAPEGVAGVAPAAVDGKGKLTGVDDTMEYCVSGETTYTAVPAGATEVEVDGGKIYNVRYAAKEGFNAGANAQVGVPYYYSLDLKGLAGVEGEVVTLKDGVYNIEVPYGTDLSSVTLDYTITTSARKSFSAYRAGAGQINTANIDKAPFLAVSDMQTNKVETVAIGAFKGADYLEAPVTLYAYELFTLFEPVQIKFSIAENDLDEGEIVDAIIAALDNRELSAEDKLTISKAYDEYDAEGFIEEALDIKNFMKQYNGATAVAKVSAFSKPIAGTAADVDGTDGTISYSFEVEYGNTTKNSTTKDIVLPAEHFRVLFKFNNESIMSIAKLSGSTNLVNTSIVDNSYVRVEFKQDATGPDVYWEIGNAYSKNDPNYSSFFNTADYPILAIKYRSNAYTGNHIYIQTDAYANGNNYEEGVGGSYLGYLWAKDKLFWSCNSTIFPVATEFNRAVINANGGTTGVSYTGQGYEGDFTFYPWTGNLNYIRGNITKNSDRKAGDYYDLEYVAFFASQASYEAWVAAGEKTAYALTAQDKATADAITVEELDGAVVSTEAMAKETALAAVTEQLNIENAEYVINTVSYTAPDADTDTKGAYKFTVTINKGDKIGDMDSYTTEEFTASISVPVLSAESAVAVISLLDDSVAPAIYNEEGAVEYVNNALLANVKSFYAGYTFTVEAETYAAPTAEEHGYLEYTVTVAKGDETASTDVLYLAIVAGEKPIIINFASEVIARYAANVLITDSGDIIPEEAFEMVEDENALGGAYAKFSRLSASPEFNFTFYPGNYGFPEIEDLEKYPVVAYRYKAPYHSKYQIYYTTDVTVSGLAYQGFAPSLDVNEWNTHIHTMKLAGNSAGATGSPAWDGNVRNIRFDFFRDFSTDATTLEIDYIGFFESVEQAEAFAAAPYLDSYVTEEEITEAKYDILESLNSMAQSIAYTKNEGLGDINEAYATVNTGADSHMMITEFVPATNGTVDDIDGTNGVVKFKIAFADSYNNGNVVYTDEFNAIIVAQPYTSAATTVEYRESDSGLRFKTTFTKDWMNFFKENDITLTYGTLVGSAAKLGETELVHGLEGIADVEGINIFSNTETDMTYTAVITNIPAGQEATDLVARAYVSYTYNGLDYVVYFDAVTASLSDVIPTEAE